MDGVMANFLQYLISGITVGATYGLAALGFNLIYNASHVINFAQGEFIMLGGMLAVFFVASGAPLPLAFLLAVILPALVGILLEKLAIAPAKNADTTALIITTIGASLFIRGLVQVWLGKSPFTLPAFSGEQPLLLAGAVMQPQSLWVIGGMIVCVTALTLFFNRTLTGKAMRAIAANAMGALITGINSPRLLMLSYALAATIGAIGGILLTPITLTSFDVGIMLGLKGFVAAVVGGLGNSWGAVLGGLFVGVLEALGAGYISSAYKDAIPFVLILFVLFFRPRGILGGKLTDRV